MSMVDWSTASSVAATCRDKPLDFYFTKLISYAPMETSAYRSVLKLLQLARDIGGNKCCDWILLLELGDLDSLNVSTIKMAHPCPIFRQLRNYIWKVEVLDPGVTTVGTTRNGPVLRTSRIALVFVRSDYDQGSSNAIENGSTVAWAAYPSDDSRVDYVIVDVDFTDAERTAAVLDDILDGHVGASMGSQCDADGSDLRARLLQWRNRRLQGPYSGQGVEHPTPAYKGNLSAAT